ncbi:hypothetical protein IQ250_26135, partial [Pseudanabaenaceae cyanobacterium LEGE 13415]|nr:hypothetical protein [Pseudanabaenaceae cyanobacterium LEGE 13415]
MQLEGYVKAGELTAKQRKSLGQPDYTYNFNSKYHAAEFYLKSRVERLQTRIEPAIELISRSQIKNGFKWSEKLIVQYADPLIIEIQQNGRLIRVYPLQEIQTLSANTAEIRAAIEASRQRSLKLEATRNAKLEAEREARKLATEAKKTERKPIC